MLSMDPYGRRRTALAMDKKVYTLNLALSSFGFVRGIMKRNTLTTITIICNDLLFNDHKVKTIK